MTVTVSLTFVLAVAGASPPTTEDLLARFAQSIADFERASFRVETQSYADDPSSPKDGPRREESYRIWRDHGRWRILSHCKTRYLENGRLVTTREANETVCNSTGCYSVVLDAATMQPRGLLVHLGAAEKQRWRVVYESLAPFPNGGVDRNEETLIRVLRGGTVKTSEQPIDGRMHTVLTSTGRWGQHTIWFDPTRGFAPRRITQRKEGQDELMISDGKVVAMNAVPPEYGGPWALVTQQVDITKFVRINDRDVISSYSSAWQIRQANGTVTNSRTLVAISEIDLTPNVSDDTFQIKTVIPNGTRVTVEGSRSINHEWQDGKIVKSVNQPSVANLDGHWFQPGSWQKRALLLAGILAAAAALYWFLRRARKPA